MIILNMFLVCFKIIKNKNYSGCHLNGCFTVTQSSTPSFNKRKNHKAGKWYIKPCKNNNIQQK